MKGILLAGGTGSRLYPMTCMASKQLLPVYDKPLIYYPLSTLVLLGIREILLVSSPKALPAYKDLLGDGSRLGIRLSYAMQPRAEGIAQALVIGADFIGRDRVALILGDNLFFGKLESLRAAVGRGEGALICAYRVKDPSRYGVIEFDAAGRALSLEEKPKYPRSHFAVPGLYVYGPEVIEMARHLEPSARGELEITDVNRLYLEAGQLQVCQLGRGIAWLDTGTPQALLEAANFIAAIENRQGLKIGCIEEAAWRMGFVDDEAFAALVYSMTACAYRDYLEELIDEAKDRRPALYKFRRTVQGKNNV
jgi:glucose-1-phosphate thymidylyltransferase